MSYQSNIKHCILNLFTPPLNGEKLNKLSYILQTHCVDYIDFCIWTFLLDGMELNLLELICYRSAHVCNSKLYTNYKKLLETILHMDKGSILLQSHDNKVITFALNCQHDNLDLVKTLLSYGAYLPPDILFKYMIAFEHSLLSERSLAMCKLLVNHGANIDYYVDGKTNLRQVFLYLCDKQKTIVKANYHHIINFLTYGTLSTYNYSQYSKS